VLLLLALVLRERGEDAKSYRGRGGGAGGPEHVELEQIAVGIAGGGRLLGEAERGRWARRPVRRRARRTAKGVRRRGGEIEREKRGKREE